ncbi:MAG TPA: Gfo/Idh/MocA family oxidoreductase [bacterium (Candidatus Stahlbacteria)]|nr:Gfo/Idh/MocA family oxidoreductase [Candidatus Stahlbacteria bacterium]
MKIRVGVVGCGAHAQTVHIPIFSQSNQFDLIAICDSDHRKLELVGEKYGIKKRYDDFQKLIGDDEIDAVVIVTPDYLHQPMAMAALEYKKHVLSEKPMARNLKEAKELARFAKKCQTVFALGLNERFRPEVQEIKRLIENGDLGRLNYLKAGWLNNWQDWQMSDWHRSRVAAGAFSSLGVHLLELTLWFLDEDPVSISGWVHKREDNIEDIAIAQLRFPEGLVNIEVGWSLLMEKDFLYCNIFASRGAVLLNPFKIHRIVRGKMVDATPKLKIRDSYLSSFRIQANFFANAINKKGEFPFCWSDGLKIAAITDAFYSSVATGREVDLS